MERASFDAEIGAGIGLKGFRFAKTRFAETRFAETPTLTLTLNPNL